MIRGIKHKGIVPLLPPNARRCQTQYRLDQPGVPIQIPPWEIQGSTRTPKWLSPARVRGIHPATTGEYPGPVSRVDNAKPNAAVTHPYVDNVVNYGFHVSIP